MATLDILAIGFGFAMPIWFWAIGLVTYWCAMSNARSGLRILGLTWVAAAVTGMAVTLARVPLTRLLADRMPVVALAGAAISLLLVASFLSARRVATHR